MRLSLVLIHELGHVFGLQHSGHYYEDLMGERFDENTLMTPYCLRKDFPAYLSREHASYENTDSYYLGASQKILNIPTDAVRIHIVEERSLNYRVDVTDAAGRDETVGRVQRHVGDGAIDPVVLVWFPPEQTAFKDAPKGESRYAAVSLVDSTSIAEYRSADGRTVVPLTLTIRGTQFRAQAPAAEHSPEANWALTGMQSSKN